MGLMILMMIHARSPEAGLRLYVFVFVLRWQATLPLRMLAPPSLPLESFLPACMLATPPCVHELRWQATLLAGMRAIPLLLNSLLLAGNLAKRHAGEGWQV